MTVVAINGGFVAGGRRKRASVMQRIAAPMIGRIVTSTVLTLVVILVLYHLWRGRELRRSTEASS